MSGEGKKKHRKRWRVRGKKVTGRLSKGISGGNVGEFEPRGQIKSGGRCSSVRVSHLRCCCS